MSHSPHDNDRKIPRNLVHSYLNVDKDLKVDMLHHAPARNQDQAKSIISTAIWTDKALRNEILNRLEQCEEDEQFEAINYDFCNVNLTSGWNTKSYPIKNSYINQQHEVQDKNYKAFKALTQTEQPCTIPFIDKNGNKRQIKVNLRISTPYIPVDIKVSGKSTHNRISKIAAFTTQSMSPWELVEERNFEELTLLIGDIGDPTEGFNGSARGTKVGGIIGDVMIELENKLSNMGAEDDPNMRSLLEELRFNLQETVDIIRDIYCSGAYNTNDGNRYKLAMAILYANSLAKQVGSKLEFNAQGNRYGYSESCMNNSAANADAMLKSINLSAETAIKLLRYNPHSNKNISPHELVSMIEPLPKRLGEELLTLGLLFTGQLETEQISEFYMKSNNTKELDTLIKDYKQNNGMIQFRK